MEAETSVGVVIPTWNRAAGALRCVRSLVGGAPAGGEPTRPQPERRPLARLAVSIVDNGSTAAERQALLAGAASYVDVEVLPLAENRGFAAAVNIGLAAAFARGAVATLVVNDDAEVGPDLIALLLDAAARAPRAGILAPRVVDDASGREVSRGERVSVPLLCLPRTWLRVRRPATSPYLVSGVLGVAFLVTRACYSTVGPLAETFFAYYEEVDYCLRARAAGFEILVVPAATVRHRGFRGFAGGFSPLAAYLKARNLPLLVRRHGGVLDWALFAPSYAALLLASGALYLTRGGSVVVGAMARGVADGLRARSGPPPAGLVPPTVA